MLTLSIITRVVMFVQALPGVECIGLISIVCPYRFQSPEQRLEVDFKDRQPSSYSNYTSLNLIDKGCEVG